MANHGARYTYVTSSKWNDGWYLSLSPQQRNLFDYLGENADLHYLAEERAVVGDCAAELTAALGMGEEEGHGG